MKEIRIEAYHPCYQDQIRQLIISIQRDEFFIPITLEDQPDLLDIEGVFQKGSGAFLLALDGKQVVGTVALVDIGNHNGALKKFYVHPDYRGKKSSAAASLLEQLIKWGQKKKFQNFYLGTTETLLAAHRFYEKNGFQQIQKEELPNQFPAAEVDSKFYRLTFLPA